MNKERRKLIASAKAAIDEAIGILEQARDEEQEYRDNMPESIGDGERGTEAELRVESLQSVIDDLENVDLSEFEEGRA